MLTLEGLMEEAKGRGLPLTKKRAILREYVQVLMLHAIYQSPLGSRLFFTGGTALRLLYQLPRFSEDLDFDASNIEFNSFKELLDLIRSRLAEEGFLAEKVEKQSDSLLGGSLRLTHALQSYGLSPLAGEKLSVKIEVYSAPWALKGRSEIIQGFGVAFPCLCLKESELLAEKLLALFNRRRGRDIYDLFFMLRRNFPMDAAVFRSRGLDDPPALEKKLREFFASYSVEELKKLQKQLAPFLFREEEGGWVEKAPEYLNAFLAGRPAAKE